MKNLKLKLLGLLMCIVLTMPTTALAESYNNYNPYVSQLDGVDGFHGSNLRATKETKDLGTSGSVGIAISDIEAQSTRTSDYYYKTGSGKFVFRLTAESALSITITLYDVNGTQIGQKTLTLQTFELSHTFSSLSTTQTFYFSIRNNDQVSSDIDGTISAK